MAVEILASPVVAHRGTRIGVAGGDLDVSQVYASVKHGGDEGVPEHVRVWAGDPDPRCLGESPQPAGGGVTVHSDAAAVEQDRPVGAGTDGLVMERPTAGGNGTRTTLVPLPHTRSTR